MPSERAKKQNVKNVLEWRRRAKRRLIEAFGGCCGICKYSKSIAALEFHHVDPAEKEFSLWQYQSKAWAKLVVEMKKCVMLCANCHREVHDGTTILPDDIRRFEENGGP